MLNLLWPQVHAIFGYTLILAGVTRMIEVCFLPFATLAPGSLEDNDSEHTLAASQAPHSTLRTRSMGTRAFRHLPPFVGLVPNISDGS